MIQMGIISKAFIIQHLQEETVEGQDISFSWSFLPLLLLGMV